MSTNNLYTKNDSIVKEPLQLIDEPGSYTIDPNEFNEEGQEVVDSLQADIASIFNDNVSFSDRPDKKKPFFTLAKGKGKLHYAIGGTVFEPSKLTMTGGKFKEKYKQQLEKYVFNTSDTIDPESLFSIVYIYELIANKTFPICITSPKHVRSLKPIVEALDEFYKEHYHTLTSIHHMLNTGDPDKLFEEK